MSLSMSNFNPHEDDIPKVAALGFLCDSRKRYNEEQVTVMSERWM